MGGGGGGRGAAVKVNASEVTRRNVTPCPHARPLPRPRRYNLSLGIGLDRVKGKVFRIGHLGNMDELMLASALAGAEMAMIDAGGAGVGSARAWKVRVWRAHPAPRATPRRHPHCPWLRH